MQYETVKDADLYLHGSIVRYKGLPVYVSGVDGGMIANCREAGKTMGTIAVPVDKLDLRPFRLGYALDYENRRSVYLERKPARSWRQGLTPANCRAKGRGGFRLPSIDSARLAGILAEDYLPIKKAFEFAEMLGYEVPFHRTFTIDFNTLVRYKTKTVGYWTGKGVVLLPKYSYLKEMVEEVR